MTLPIDAARGQVAQLVAHFLANKDFYLSPSRRWTLPPHPIASAGHG